MKRSKAPATKRPTKRLFPASNAKARRRRKLNCHAKTPPRWT